MNRTDIETSVCAKCKGPIHRHSNEQPWSHDFFRDFMRCGIAIEQQKENKSE